MTITPVLLLRGASHGDTLRGVDLAVQPGEFVAVLGAPGSGKSTLLALAAGLAAPATGQVLIDGSDLAVLGRAELAELLLGRVAHIPQRSESALDPTLTAVENIALPHELAGSPAHLARQRALTILLELELAEVAERLPEQLSPAHRQAVSVARGLVGQRHLVLADEPAVGLQGELADTVLAMLRLRRPSRAAVLLATSDPEHAAWADRVLLLRDGVLSDTATAATAGTAVPVVPDAPGDPAGPALAVGTGA